MANECTVIRGFSGGPRAGGKAAGTVAVAGKARSAAARPPPRAHPIHVFGLITDVAVTRP
ncbi:hypothetical protein GGQ67_001382 [Rhizobium metallidurans]|uniref:Uncharacterized protein n=1 Tax=Rhizobium metallidurans TaxID=1265931 RepID=A0A7W6G9N7_9HYPH|nr:hypothetical protein [Rhizobium metallidurans]